MKTILVITCSYDHTVDYMISTYQADACFFRLNVDKLQEYSITITDSVWKISYKNINLSKNDVFSIYYRKPSFPDTHEYGDGFSQLICNDILALIDGIANSFNGIVLTKPYILREVENKVFQLMYAAEHNIAIPQSFVGNNDSFKSIRQTKIIKPLSTGRITTKDDAGIIQTNIMHDNDEYDEIALTPIYVQKYIQKNFEARITAVGNDLYTVKIESDNAVDWRKGISNRLSIIEAPIEVRSEIDILMNDFNIRFGAFDYIIDKNDNWIFLEVNPNGQWQWLEHELDLPISRSIMNILLGE